MIEKRLKFQILKKKLFSKRRFIIFNENTLAETFSIKLTFMNMLVVVSLGAILIRFITNYIIAFTSLYEYIPRYALTEKKYKITVLSIKNYSLQCIVNNNNQYLKAIQSDLEYAKPNKDSIKTINDALKNIDLSTREKKSVYNDLTDVSKFAGNTVKSGEALVVFGNQINLKLFHFEL